MGRFLFVGGDAGGDVGPRIAVIEELVRRGHDVDHLGVPWVPNQIDDGDLAKRLDQRAEAAGARAVRHQGWAPAPPGSYPTRPIEELARFDNVLASTFFVPMAAAIANAVHSQLSTGTYDGVALDMGMPAATAACEARGVPYVLLVNTIPFGRWWPGRPCPGTGRRLSADMGEDEALGRTMEELFDAVLLDVVNGCRREFGLEDLAHVYETEARAAAVVVMTSAAFDHGSDHAPRNYHYVGPCLPGATSDDGQASALLRDLDDEQPLVVMSPTTTGFAVGQVPFVRASIEALASLPVSGIVTVGRNLDPSRFQGTDNVRVAGHVDHRVLLPRASAMITHCGHGTTMTALRFGVPLVGLPDFADQRDIAARIADHGVGIVVGKPPSAEELREAVGLVLGERSFRDAAHRLASVLAAEDGPRAAADVIDLHCINLN